MNSLPQLPSNRTARRTPSRGAQHRRTDSQDLRVAGTAEVGTILALILRRRWPILLTFLGVFGSAVGYTFFKPPLYEAEMRIRLSGQPETAGTPNHDSGVAEVEILKSRSVLEELARKTGMGAKGVETLENDIKATGLTGTNLIQVKYRDRSAENSARILNLLGEIYLSKQKQLNQHPATATLYTAKLQEVEAQWAAAQEELDLLRQESSTPMLLEQRQSAVRRGSDLESGLEEVRSQIAEARDKLAAIQAQLAQQPSAIESNRRTAASTGLVEGLKSQLLQLEVQRTDLLSKYDPSNRNVKQLEKQIATVKEMLEREQSFRVVERTESLNPLHQSLSAEKLRLESSLAGLRAREVALTGAASRVRGASAQMEEFSIRLEELTRKAKIAEDTYLLFLKKEQEAQAADLAAGISGMQASILEAAAVPLAPVSNHRSFVLALGFLAACFFAAAASLITEYVVYALPHAIAAARIVQSAPIRVPLAGPGDAAAFHRKRLDPTNLSSLPVPLHQEVISTTESEPVQ
ncbi:GumC family protein [Bryobacter aggregatus]|uniref:GumC family protein n=1 Tax=Bryobacter aggregatus TaxID=360054 RepID=UPI001EE27DDC|nr:Wzz/FepE/Etk N-terminal domain-containing protein [Bryobacter aggregatus]